MNYLICAEKYCEQFGDELWFKQLYTANREYHSVKDSVWLALRSMYSAEVAEFLAQRQTI